MRKDGTISYQGRMFEVPYELAGKTVRLVVNPHLATVVGVENDAGETLGPATPLDVLANCHRTRRQPAPPDPTPPAVSGPNLIELAHHQYHHPEGD